MNHNKTPPLLELHPNKKNPVVVTEPESNHESTMIHHPQWFVSVLWHLGMVCVGDLTCFRQAKRSEAKWKVSHSSSISSSHADDFAGNPHWHISKFSTPMFKSAMIWTLTRCHNFMVFPAFGFHCNCYRIETSSINWDLCPKKNSEQLALVLGIWRRFLPRIELIYEVYVGL